MKLKLKLIALAGLLAGAALGLSSTAHASIVGSAHDFTASTNYWINGTTDWAATAGRSTNVCGECHTIHHAPDPARGPLWIHTPSAQTFKTYDQSGSETYSGTAVTLGSSKACLSCHDGSVAINSQDALSGGVVSTSTKGTTPVFIKSSASVVEVSGTVDDLTHMHPVGVNYATCRSTLAVGELNDPSTAVSGAGGSIAKVMLKNGNVECSSCHDIHRTQGGSASSGIYTIASGQQLCLTCHNK